jgi:hypothetical protein
MMLIMKYNICQIIGLSAIIYSYYSYYSYYIIVSDPDKGVCADPVNRGAILGRGESDPHSESRECQLAPDKGRGKT